MLLRGIVTRGMSSIAGDALAARLAALEAENKVLRERVEEETVARTRAEIALREQFMEATGGAGLIKPVGRIATCFPSRFGTPRQGSLATLTRGVIRIDPSVVAGSSLTGLEGFSHVWVIFVFHENTNMHKFASQNSNTKIFPSFVRPPQGGGKRVGLFATRTPHRPNPIGLSLVELDQVDVSKGLVHLRGVDLVDGTPILDIKPFVPHVDFPCHEKEPTVPTWVKNPKFETVPVEFAPGVKEELENICQLGQCKWFGKAEFHQLLSALEQVITLDPRGVIHGRGQFKSSTDAEECAEEGVAKNDAVPLAPSEKPKEHLFRDNFVLDFDTMRLAFRPHHEKRVIVVHAAELRHNKKDLALGKAFQVGPKVSVD